MKLKLSDLLGKYRDLSLAIALFLVIDLGVLVFNFQSSRLLAADTIRINLASDMRVYSQQLAKAVLSLKQESLDGQSTHTSVAQISEAYSAYTHATTTLQKDLNRPKRELFDDLASIKEAQVLLSDLAITWEPISSTIKPLLDQSAAPVYTYLVMKENIDIAANKVVARNVRLMQQAEDLTKFLEGMSVHRAEQMQAVQVIAIMLALVNFVFIVFKFLRSLVRSDRDTATARTETNRILNTVREGLFLLSRKGEVGIQQSLFTTTLLGRKFSAGENFFTYLAQRMSADNAKAVENYISVLFNERVKPSLLKQLNPLREVEFKMDDGSLRHLDFEFQQVMHDKYVEYLLVSVSDITEKIVLAKELAGVKAIGKSEVESLIAVLEQDPHTVSKFLDESKDRLLSINCALQEITPSNLIYQQLINQIARVVHGIKGESGVFGLIPIEIAAHAFEKVLSPLREKNTIAGNDLIPVAVAMNELLEEIEKVKQVLFRLMNYAFQSRPGDEIQLKDVFHQITQLTARVAHDFNKKVRFEAHQHDIELPLSHILALREALPQLVRNAVAHGIESVEDRLRAGKPEEGVVRCSLEVGEDRQFIIAFEDDGRGLEPHLLRQRIIAKGLRSAEEVSVMSDEDVIALIFSPGFSSLDEANVHAGRGDGLSVVKEIAERMGARLRISSRPQQYTRFAFLFQDNRWLFG